MNPTEIAFACYAITDVKLARAFYEGVLGLKPGSVFEKEGMAFIEYEMGPHTLAIGAGAPQFKPGPGGATVALEVPDFEETLRHLKSHQVEIVMDAYETPVCHMAIIKEGVRELVANLWKRVSSVQKIGFSG